MVIPKLASFFRTAPLSKGLIDVGLLAARLGMALVFIRFGINHVLHPEQLVQGIQMSMGFVPSVATNATFLVGIGEIIAGILVALGIITRITAGFQIFILIGALARFRFDYIKTPAIWKDPGLFGLAIIFLLYGPGRLSLDYLISRREQMR